jgi:hypothetical protein
VSARRPFGRVLIATAIVIVATVAVGLTAGSEGPFSIAVRPVFLRLGVDLDVKLGTLHLHANWSALPDAAPGPEPSTKTSSDQL